MVHCRENRDNATTLIGLHDKADFRSATEKATEVAFVSCCACGAGCLPVSLWLVTYRDSRAFYQARSCP